MMDGGAECQLLDVAVFGVEDAIGNRTTVTLPGFLARLSRGEATEATALQAHQQHAWHAFLVQLGALALVRSDDPARIERTETEWRALLVRAAEVDGADASAFALVVSDLTKPAFLQPPIPSGKLTELKNEHSLPSEELDVLVTSKNHDVKSNHLSAPTLEHWVYALVTLQTMQGFLGAGNYGIARMNGGFASRPCVAFAPGQSAAVRFVRDVRVLLEARPSLLERFSSNRGIGLVWCVPWDGTRALALHDLDPFFIEVCRRIRLTNDADGRLVAHRGSSKVARIEAKEAHGNTGDAWTPVDDQGASLTLPESGFSYDRVSELLFGKISKKNWTPGTAGVLRSADGERPWFVGQALVRGQGRTDGFHERWVPVPKKARVSLLDDTKRATLGAIAKTWIGLAGTVRLKVLKPALLTLLQGGPEKLKFDDDRANPALTQFDAVIDGAFFPLLFEHADDQPEVADREWQQWLFDRAKEHLEQAIESLPVGTARRARAIAHAERTLHGAAHRQLPNLFQSDSAAQPEGNP